MAAAGAYVAILALWALVLRLGGKPTLWKGQSLLIFNILFVIVTLVALLARGEQPGYAMAAFLGLLIVGGIAALRLSLLLNIDRSRTTEIIEKCLAQTRAKYELNDGRYLVRSANQFLVIEVNGAPPVLRIRFTGGSGSKKAELIRSLFAKQFRGSVPTPRFRT